MEFIQLDKTQESKRKTCDHRSQNPDLLEMFEALINIRYEKVFQLKQDGFDLNIRDSSGGTLLHKLAIEEESLEAIMLAVEIGVDVNSLDDSGASALYLVRKYLVHDRYNKMIDSYLVENGAVSLPCQLDHLR